jgi:hypothetical protein
MQRLVVNARRRDRVDSRSLGHRQHNFRILPIALVALPPNSKERVVHIHADDIH